MTKLELAPTRGPGALGVRVEVDGAYVGPLDLTVEQYAVLYLALKAGCALYAIEFIAPPVEAIP